MSSYKEIDLHQVKTYSIKDRPSKVNIADFAKPLAKGLSFAQFLESLPRILKGKDLLQLIGDMERAISIGKPIIIMMGAHVIKCGLSPLIIQLLERRIINCIALNGAGVIHDTELAYWGFTSEDVAKALEDGSFGMVRETPQIIQQALSIGKNLSLGFGEAVGKKIFEDKSDYGHLSILATGFKQHVPITIHVAIGTDIIHQHGVMDGANIGELSHRDFRIFAERVGHLGDGGILLNFGSAVVLPEVFLKALTVARNLGNPVFNFITANFDMFRHYRPQMNVLQRPTQTSGKAYEFIGHHEIMIPLLCAGLSEMLNQ
jgi:hypothetical protein